MGFFKISKLRKWRVASHSGDQYIKGFDPRCDFVIQAADNWCWLAAAIFVARRFEPGKFALPNCQEQYLLAKMIYENNPPVQQDSYNVTDFVQTAFVKLCEELIVCVEFLSEDCALSESDVANAVGDDLPIVLRLQENPRSSLHYVVVVGYTKDSDGTCVPLLMDPKGQFGSFWLFQLVAPFLQEKILIGAHNANC